MQRTPGMYTEINTQTQRTGLPNQSHSIVLITSDAQAPATPTPIYDTATADSVSGDNSNAGRMIAAALSVSQGVRVDTVGKSEPSDGSGGDDGSSGDNGGSTEPLVCTASAPVLVNLEMPAGTTNVYARYRVNGGDWVIYSKELNSSNVHQAHKDFLSSITASELTLINLMPTEEGGNELVTIKSVGLIDCEGIGYISHLVDSSGRSDLDPDFNPADQAIEVMLPCPFVYCKDNWADDYVAAASSVNTPAYDIDRPNGDYSGWIPPSTIKHVKPTTIEFVTSTGTGLDLVQAMFDGNKTISACGFAVWLGE